MVSIDGEDPVEVMVLEHGDMVVWVKTKDFRSQGKESVTLETRENKL